MILGVVGGLVGGPVGLVAGANIGAAAALTGETSANIIILYYMAGLVKLLRKWIFILFLGESCTKSFFV